MNEFCFYFVAGSLCVFSVLCVTVPNVFHSAVWLALLLLSTSGIYFYLGASFLGVVQILVYVGGIMTLFIFTIKLTARIDDVSIQQVNRQVWLGALVAIGMGLIVLMLIFSGPWQNAFLQSSTVDLKLLGKELMTVYALPFEFMSLLLLAAMVGAIVIGRIKK